MELWLYHLISNESLIFDMILKFRIKCIFQKSCDHTMTRLNSARNQMSGSNLREYKIELSNKSLKMCASHWNQIVSRFKIAPIPITRKLKYEIGPIFRNDCI